VRTTLAQALVEPVGEGAAQPVLHQRAPYPARARPLAHPGQAARDACRGERPRGAQAVGDQVVGAPEQLVAALAIEQDVGAVGGGAPQQRQPDEQVRRHARDLPRAQELRGRRERAPAAKERLDAVESDPLPRLRDRAGLIDARVPREDRRVGAQRHRCRRGNR
jgi:hypothetical protein